MIFELAEDFTAVLAAMPADHPKRRMLSLLEEAIRRDIHFIARHPTTLFQCMWNSCWWYDCPDAAKHYVEPESGWTKPPPWESPGPKLCDLLTAWRSAKEEATPGVAWLQCHRPPPIHLGTAQKAILSGHKGEVLSVSYSMDGQRIFSGSGDGTVRVWDANTGAELAVLRGHEDSVHTVSYSPDGRRIASGSLDGTVRVWDAAIGAELKVFSRHESSVNSLAYSPDGQQVASGYSDNIIRVWDIDSGAEVAVFRGHEGKVVCVSYSPNGRRIISGSSDKTVRVWEIGAGVELAVLHGNRLPVTCLLYSPDGRRIVGKSRYHPIDGFVWIWDADTGECLEEIRSVGGVGDLAAIAAENSSGRSWRAIGRVLETVISEDGGGDAAAMFPVNLSNIVTHPSGKTWAGFRGNHIYFIDMEGGGAARVVLKTKQTIVHWLRSHAGRVLQVFQRK